MTAFAAGATALDQSPRPVVRPVAEVTTSPRPEPRPAAARQEAVTTMQVSTANRGFQRWIEGFRGRAQANGISGRTFDAAFRDVRYNTDVIQRDRNQSEFVKPIWEYLD
ncbi:MAG: lytic murein transglycosylase, partial [Rhodovulum sp.]